MRQVLLYFPVNEPWDLGPLGQVPGFGWFGLLFWLWTAWHVWQFWSQRRSHSPSGDENASADWLSIAIPWGVGAVIIGEFPRFFGGMLPNGVPIYGYGFMLLLGLIGGGALAMWRARQVGIEPDLIWDLASWLFFPGIIGARVFYLVQKRAEVFRNGFGPQALFDAVNLSNGGLVLYGGLIAGAAGFFLFCRRHKLNPLLLGDIVMPAVFVGIGFGRLGCLLNGCCYGDRCDFPWGISFPAGSVTHSELVMKGFVLPDSAWTPPLHPTQIYSAFDGFLMAAVTCLYFPYRRKNGDAMLVGWLIYPITRFLIEFVRGDELGQFQTSLTIGQWVSLGIFAAGAIFFSWRVWREISQKTPGVST